MSENTHNASHPMKTNNHIHAFTCATSHARHTSSTRFLTKLLPAFAASLFALTLSAPNAKANAETGAQTTNTSKGKETQDLINLLTPQITLCKSLQKIGSSVEFRGENYQGLLKALKALDVSDYSEIKKSFGISSDAPTNPAEEFQSTIKGRLRMGMGIGRSMPLVLKTSFKVGEDAKRLILISYGEDYFDRSPPNEGAEKWMRLDILPQGAGTSGEWTEHPDGNGYVCDWYLKDNPGLIVVATKEELGAFSGQMREYRQKQDKLLMDNWQRVRLGELSEEASIQKQNQIVKEANDYMLAKLLEWAESL